RPLGLRVGQFGLLTAVSGNWATRPAELCRRLHIDKSTLSRDLDLMRRNGWLEILPGPDARSQELRVTPEGADLLRRATPAWEEAQTKASELLGETGVAAIRDMAAGLGFNPPVK